MFGTQMQHMSPRQVKAIEVRKTVEKASELAHWYAFTPAAMIVCEIPGTLSKSPVGMTEMKSGILLAGRPASTRAGGTWPAIVWAMRLLRTAEYTAVAMVPRADLTLLATPPAVGIGQHDRKETVDSVRNIPAPISRWSLHAIVDRPRPSISAQPMKKQPMYSSPIARLLVSGVHVAIPN